MTSYESERDRKAEECHIKWTMFMNPSPDDTSCPDTPSQVYVEAFNSGYDACLESSLVKGLVEALNGVEIMRDPNGGEQMVLHSSNGNMYRLRLGDIILRDTFDAWIRERKEALAQYAAEINRK